MKWRLRCVKAFASWRRLSEVTVARLVKLEVCDPECTTKRSSSASMKPKHLEPYAKSLPQRSRIFTNWSWDVNVGSCSLGGSHRTWRGVLSAVEAVGCWKLMERPTEVVELPWSIFIFVSRQWSQPVVVPTLNNTSNSNLSAVRCWSCRLAV
jgi:hypothetical protein